MVGGVKPQPGDGYLRQTLDAWQSNKDAGRRGQQSPPVTHAAADRRSRRRRIRALARPALRACASLAADGKI